MDVIWWVILVTAVILVVGGIAYIAWLNGRQRTQARRDSPKSDRQGGATIWKDPPRSEGHLRRGLADS